MRLPCRGCMQRQVTQHEKLQSPSAILQQMHAEPLMCCNGCKQLPLEAQQQGQPLCLRAPAMACSATSLVSLWVSRVSIGKIVPPVSQPPAPPVPGIQGQGSASPRAQQRGLSPRARGPRQLVCLPLTSDTTTVKPALAPEVMCWALGPVTCTCRPLSQAVLS